MKILGISCYYHDSAAALIQDGTIIAAAQEERFSRVKGDERFPQKAIQFCIDEAQIRIEDIDAIVFYEKPFLKFERILETYLNTAPKGLKSFLTAMPSWLQKKLNQKKLLKNEFKKYFNFNVKNIYFSEHHLSHAASAFFPSPFVEAAVLCIDGVGEWQTTSAWYGSHGNLQPLWDIQFPHSLGLLYSTFTHYCGFKINSGEYKLMGLAPFGKPIYAELIKSKLIHLKPNGHFWLDTEYFGFIDDLVSTNKKFESLFGRPARKPEDEMDDFYKNVAASIQIVLNESVLNLVLRLKKDTKSDQLCLAGGVALNCVANGLIAESNIFKNIWIQPAAGDAGGALGCALAFYHLHLKKDREVQISDSMRSSFLGPQYSGEIIEKELIQCGLNFVKKEEVVLIDDIAQLLSKNKIVGWFQGKMEYGPRALGARSILGNPLDPNMKAVMNKKIKFREGFRPFAPIVKEESYGKYFWLSLKNEYMLLISKVKNKNLMPSITHIDETARVQIITLKKNPRLYKLLDKFEQITGHPVLINTSFNIRSEPIVCTPKDAINCFINTDIDVLVLENFMITKADNKQITRNDQWHEQFALD